MECFHVNISGLLEKLSDFFNHFLKTVLKS